MSTSGVRKRSTLNGCVPFHWPPTATNDIAPTLIARFFNVLFSATVFAIIWFFICLSPGQGVSHGENRFYNYGKTTI